MADPDPAAGEPDLQAYSQCMRDNGITEFPDPGPDGLFLDGTGINPDSSQFKAAEEACEYVGPRSDPAAPGGSGSAGQSEWEQVVPGGDCVCADRSVFAFWERRADPTRVVLSLDFGDAACAIRHREVSSSRAQRPLEQP
jgi:hypothetical protein